MKVQPPMDNFKVRQPLLIALIVGFALVVFALLVIGMSDLTGRETTLLGTVLTLISIAMGWGVSHYYSIEDKTKAIAEIRDFEQKNLRTFALKAAEKVTNLSTELNRLAAYLNEELQYTEYRNAEEELFAKEERIESAIHMLASLRSMNDTSLSDWQGVIGEELQERRENAEEQAEILELLTERISALETLPRDTQTKSVDHAIDQLKRELRSVAASVNAHGFKAKHKPSYQLIRTFCPSCGESINYEQRAKENDQKAVQCKKCETNLISTYREATGYDLKIRREIDENINCPSCSFKQIVALDEWPSASTTATCPECSNGMRISRIDNGAVLKITRLGQQLPLTPLTPDLIEKVKTLLPQQPWPKGIHISVANTLSIRPTVVQKAIQHLIKMGVFQDQLNGVVCTTEEKLALLRSAGTNL